MILAIPLAGFLAAYDQEGERMGLLRVLDLHSGRDSRLLFHLTEVRVQSLKR